MDVLFACIREVAVNLLYSNPLLSLSRWKRYPCVNFFEATVNVSLAPLNSNPSETLESSSLKGSRREEQWSLLQQGGHKPWQPRNSPDTARLPALVNTALRKTCVEDTVTEVGWRWRWGKLHKQSKSMQAKHMALSLEMTCHPHIHVSDGLLAIWFHWTLLPSSKESTFFILELFTLIQTWKALMKFPQ